MFKLNVYCYKKNQKDVLHKFKVKKADEVKFYLLSLIKKGYQIRYYFFDGTMISMEDVFLKLKKETLSFNEKKVTVPSYSNVSEWHESFYRRYMNCISIVDELRGWCEIKPKKIYNKSEVVHS